VQAESEDHDKKDADLMQGDDGPGCSPAARRVTEDVQRACWRATKYSERACFTTCPAATLACAAREVTLYLAVDSYRFRRISSRSRRTILVNRLPSGSSAPWSPSARARQLVAPDKSHTAARKTS
jgi:hypothetical protein